MKRGSIPLFLLCMCVVVLTACDVAGGATSNAQSQKPRVRLEALTPAPLDTPLPLVLPTQTAVPIPAVPPTEVPPPPTLALDTKAVEKQLLQVEADTAKMRGLKPKAAVPVRFVSADEMRYMTAQDTLKSYTPEMARLDAVKKCGKQESDVARPILAS